MLSLSHARRAARLSWTSCAFALAAGLVACEGSMGMPNGPGSPGSSPVGVSPTGGNATAPGEMGGGDAAGGNPGGVVDPSNPSAPVLARCVTPAVSAAPMRRLTHREYENAVRDLLGDKAILETALATDSERDLYDTLASQNVSVLLADQYLDAAAHLAQGVTDVKSVAGCDPATGSSCVSAFIKRFGRRAFRRPLTDDELKRFTSLHDTTRAASDAPSAVRVVVAAALASPNFLYRPEFGAGASTLPSALKASPFELATRMSFLLWGSGPDDVLLDAAANGMLASKEQVATQVRRMLADARAKRGLRAFYEQWFGLELLETATKDAAVYSLYNDALRDAMIEETRRFIDYVLWQDDAKLSTLLTAPYGFVNGALAKVYGVSGPADATSFGKVALDPKQRSGVLTQASIMAAFAGSNESSPVKRGKWVRTRMLCQDLPAPPANIPPLPPPKQGVSTRERFAMHTASPACSGCHNLIDGLGFGLERYDGIGALRTTDHGVMVDSSGEVTATSDINGKYDGGPALAALLAKSQQARDCVPTQWFRFSAGRRESADDSCSLIALKDAFRAQDGNLKELVLALTQSDAFLNYRKPD